MASITNYSTLVQAIKDEAEDDGTEFASFIPTAIDIAEERLFRELDLPELEVKASGTLTTNVQELAKPTGYEFAQYLVVGQGTSKQVLKKKSGNYLQDYWPDSSVTGLPKYYADLNASQFILAPTPETNYPYEIRYTKKPTKLSTTNATNYYTDNCQDILFMLCMVEMAKFMKAFQQLTIWQNEYNALKEGWNVQSMRYRRDGVTMPRNPDNAPNSLKHSIMSQA